MANVLVVLEQRDGDVKHVSHEALGAGRHLADALGGEAYALVIGPASLDTSGLGGRGAAKVYHAASDDLTLYQPAAYAGAVAARVEDGDYAAVVLPATALGKDLGPRIAARLEAPLAADVIEISAKDGIVVKRPVYSGKAVCTVKITQMPCVISTRPNVFAAKDGNGEAPVEKVDVKTVEDGRGRSRTVEVKHPDKERPDVAEAPIIVSGGRGMKGPENFHLIEELADALGAAVGASRAVVDAGWRPHAEQVGQTGKTVSPSLYVAVGISGAIQHLAGMRTSKTIVAINKDKDAPIFKVADYGIVGDAFEIVPKLTQAIKQLKDG
jgi:electron transfer flavoprotein alpha subunit